MIKIIPAILAKTYDEFESMVRKIEPYTNLVHLDVADGEFVPNKTISGYEELKKLNTNLNFEVHLMVKNPEANLSQWLETKASRYLIHWESTQEYDTVINQFGVNGKEFGFVFNPQTDWSALEPYIDRIDLVQFMTVDPGFYGSPFLPDVLEKVRNFHSQYPSKKIQVDGGIHSSTIQLVAEAGAGSAVLGSHIFSEGKDIGEAMKELNV